MSTLAVVEEVLRETMEPMSVREIVQRAGARLPSKSKTPDTVVARDLSMDIKRLGDTSRFVRTSPGRYALRAALAATPPSPAVEAAGAPVLRVVSGERVGTLPAKSTAPLAAVHAYPKGRSV